uniref:Uncharacterized protein n=1 Tax=Photinus pyralis TaxID=7054 RepID=A0A1Y1LDL1_PHOPY
MLRRFYKVNYTHIVTPRLQCCYKQIQNYCRIKKYVRSSLKLNIKIMLGPILMNWVSNSSLFHFTLFKSICNVTVEVGWQTLGEIPVPSPAAFLEESKHWEG